MADFPETPHASSTVEYVDEARLRRARNGTPKIRRLQSGSIRVFGVVLRGLTAARRDALIAVYDAKRSTTLTFAWPPTSETAIVVLFGPEPIRWDQDGNRWNAELMLYEAAP